LFNPQRLLTFIKGNMRKDVNELCLAKLTERFSELNITPISDYGANIYLDNLVVTVYWGKKKKYGLSNGKWFEYDLLTDFMDILDGLIKPKQKAIILTEATQSDNGTQQCIDHLIKKIEYGKKNNMPTTNIVMMQTLIEEFKQFL